MAQQIHYVMIASYEPVAMPHGADGWAVPVAGSFVTIGPDMYRVTDVVHVVVTDDAKRVIGQDVYLILAVAAGPVPNRPRKKI